MLNLSYSASYDPYNTVYRMVSLLSAAEGKVMKLESLLVADFYFCFPIKLADLNPPNSVSGMRGRINRFLKAQRRSNHELLPDSRTLFERMKVIQQTALSAMSANGIITINGDKEDKTAQLNLDKVSGPLRASVAQYREERKDLIQILSHDIPSIPLEGKDGLRARTGLGEWQYDNV